MFARISPRYDLANRVLSCGVDGLWRRAAVRFAGARTGEHALDVCAGTGDLALVLARAGLEVVAADFCPEMVALAPAKARRAGVRARVRALAADVLALPVPDASFDLVTVAFGLRNVVDPDAALSEMTRVLRPGGRLVVLEFGRPRVPILGRVFGLYFRHVLPRLGAWISGDRGGAYAYLESSVRRFPDAGELLERFAVAGLVDLAMRPLTGGVAWLYRGVRRGP